MLCLARRVIYVNILDLLTSSIIYSVPRTRNLYWSIEGVTVYLGLNV